MKFVLLSLLVSVSIHCFGQTLYYPNPENKKFEGVWQFNSADYAVTITLTNYAKVPLAGLDITTDAIKGGVKLVKNGNVVLDKPHAILSATSSPNSPFLLLGRFSDGEEGAGAKLTFSFPDTTNLNKLQLVIAPIHYPKGMYKDVKLRLPKSIILYRKQ